jgi:UDP-glucuronate 4-epimerase
LPNLFSDIRVLHLVAISFTLITFWLGKVGTMRGDERRGTVLVTGAAGLIGNAVRTTLEASGWSVVPVDVVDSTREGKPIFVCDIGDIHRLHAIASQHRLEGIIHCGAHSGPMVARDNPYSMVQVNIVGTANILELARVHGGIRVVYCSSTSVYGNAARSEPVAEDVALFPVTVYGASKVAGEQLISTYASQFGLDGVSLRLSWVYGPRRTTDCVIRTMITNALAGAPTRIPYGRGFHRQYIHVDDAANALISALERTELPRRTYSVTGGSHLTFDEIAATVRKVLPSADIELGEGPDPEDGVQPRFDISAAERDLNFRPSLTFEQGVIQYTGWLRNQRSEQKP